MYHCACTRVCSESQTRKRLCGPWARPVAKSWHPVVPNERCLRGGNRLSCGAALSCPRTSPTCEGPWAWLSGSRSRRQGDNGWGCGNCISLMPREVGARQGGEPMPACCPRSFIVPRLQVTAAPPTARATCAPAPGPGLTTGC